MLEYVKTILSKVSFDQSLFDKELAKAIAQLIPSELYDLKQWCYNQFGSVYPAVLNKHFAGVS